MSKFFEGDGVRSSATGERSGAALKGKPSSMESTCDDACPFDVCGNLAFEVLHVVGETAGDEGRRSARDSASCPLKSVVRKGNGWEYIDSEA